MHACDWWAIRTVCLWCARVTHNYGARMVRMRLEPQDDYLHAVETASNFNESRYYNWFDPGVGMGGWVRMGNRPNEGYAEMTVCLLPARRPGRVQLQAPADRRPRRPRRRRPALRGGRAVRGAPRHLRRQGVRARTAARDGRPEDARSTTTRTCRARSTSRCGASAGRGAASPSGTRARAKPDLDPEKMFARGHTEQHMAITGTVTVGDESFEITDGLGLRDHSWGPRFWQNIWWYRWLTVNLGPELGFALTISGTEEDPDAQRVGGFLYDVDRYGDDRWVRSATASSRRTTTTSGSRPRTTRRSPPTTTSTRSTATCGRTSRCATGARAW